MANFEPKPWTNPFEKTSIFRLLKLLVLQPRTLFLSFQNITKHSFLFHIAQKKKLEKRPILAQNHGVTPLEKRQFFDFLNFLFLQPRTLFFLFQNIIKHSFLFYIVPPKKLEKRPILAQTHGLTPLEKGQFFDFLNIFFLQPKKFFFRSRTS